MKKLLSVVPVLLLFTMISAPNAHADSYTVTITCASNGCPPFLEPPTASDVSFPAPTTIVLTIFAGGGQWFPADIALPSPDLPTDDYQWSYSTINCCDSDNPNPPGSVTISDLTDGQSVTNFYGFGFFGDSHGTLTFSPASAAAPEPTPIILTLLGAGLMFFMRRRFVMRSPRTA
jgi:hypothetical protein